MRLKFFQSPSSKTSVDDSSYSSSSTSQSSWHNNNIRQQQRAVTEPRRGVSPYVQQQQQEQQHNRPKTLNTVMQLFEENQQQSTAPTTTTATSLTKRNLTYQQEPYRIKANGAVVINRSNNINSDNILLGSTSVTSSSHISTTSSFDASTAATTNAFISQPIAADIHILDRLPQHQQNDDSGDDTTDGNAGGKDGTIKSSNVLEPVVQQPKMRMESNSSRSTFPSHDTTRFSIDSVSLCSKESWTSSVVIGPPEENCLTCEPQHHHATALSPPPRDLGKKWQRDRAYSKDEDDACETLTGLNSDHGAITSSTTLSLQEQQQHYHDHNHYLQKDQLNKWRSMFELANQENARLRQQIQSQQSEHIQGMGVKAEALADARRENKYLRGALSRIQMLSNTDAAYNKEKLRRQSTGEITMIFPASFDVEDYDGSSIKRRVGVRDEREPSMVLSNRGFHGSVALSYERKITILLDEIEGMQAEEEIMHRRQSKLVTKNSMLEQQLLARDEYIKQLEHDLRIMRLQCE